MKIGEVGTSNWIRQTTIEATNTMYDINSAATNWEPDLSEFEVNYPNESVLLRVFVDVKFEPTGD